MHWEYKNAKIQKQTNQGTVRHRFKTGPKINKPWEQDSSHLSIYIILFWRLFAKVQTSVF